MLCSMQSLLNWGSHWSLSHTWSWVQVELEAQRAVFVSSLLWHKKDDIPPNNILEGNLPHANSLGVLEHFHKFIKEGDYIVYDDTDPEAPTKINIGWVGTIHHMKHGATTNYTPWRSLWQSIYEDFFRVDSYLTDLFGYNATDNWNGYVRRMKWH